MKKKLKWSGFNMFLVLFVLSSIVLAAPVTIRFGSFATIDEFKVYEELFREFEAQNPNIKVKAEFTPTGYGQKLQMEMAAGNPVDLALYGFDGLATFAAKKAVIDLAPLIERDSFPVQHWYPAVWEMAEYGTSVYGIPRETSSINVYYNKTLFDRANISYPDSSWDWGTYLDVARKLTLDSSGRDSLDPAFDPTAISQWGTLMPTWSGLWHPMMLSFGGDILNAEKTESILTADESIAALQYIADLRWKYHVAPSPAEISGQTNMFVQGRVGMYLGGYWDILTVGSHISGFEWDVASIPMGKAGRYTRVATNLYIIPAKAKHPEEAWEVLKFLTSKDSYLRLAGLGVIIPARKDIAESQEFLSIGGETPRNKKVFVDTLEIGVPYPVTVTSAQWNQAMNSELDALWSGAVDAVTAAAKAKQAIDNILKQ